MHRCVVLCCFRRFFLKLVDSATLAAQHCLSMSIYHACNYETDFIMHTSNGSWRAPLGHPPALSAFAKGGSGQICIDGTSYKLQRLLSSRQYNSSVHTPPFHFKNDELERLVGLGREGSRSRVFSSTNSFSISKRGFSQILQHNSTT